MSQKAGELLVEPIHVAAYVGDTKMIRYLIGLGANANAVDKKDQTPLHYAAALGWVEAVKVLVEEGGADCNLVSYWDTPFDLV